MTIWSTTLRLRELAALVTVAAAAACDPPRMPHQPDDLDATPRALPPRGDAPCRGKEVGAIYLRGTLRDSDLLPVQGAPLGRREDDRRPGTFLESDHDGAYQLVLDGSGWAQPLRWWHWPVALCAAVPETVNVRVPEGSWAAPLIPNADFELPRLCDLSVTVEAAAEVWVETPRRFALANAVEPGTHTLRVPCDALGVLALGDAGVSEAGGTCGAHTALRCVDWDGMTLPLVPRVPVRGVVRSSDGPLEGVRVTALAGETVTDADGHFSLPTPAGPWEVHLAHDGHAPAVLSIHGALTGDTWSISLPEARRVEVRCAGQPDDRCVAEVRCRAANEPAEVGRTCPRVRGFGTVCECPAGDAVLASSGVETLVPSEAGLAWFDWRGARHTVRGSVPDHHSCGVVATRTSRGDGPAIGFASCEDGEFQLEVGDGTWRIEVMAAGLRHVATASGSTDLGTIR
jgi:hypothetical protein